MLQFMDHNQDRDMEGVEEQVNIVPRILTKKIMKAVNAILVSMFLVPTLTKLSMLRSSSIIMTMIIAIVIMMINMIMMIIINMIINIMIINNMIMITRWSNGFARIGVNPS